jgi:H+/Cl- antiporter ClcA
MVSTTLPGWVCAQPLLCCAVALGYAAAYRTLVPAIVFGEEEGGNKMRDGVLRAEEGG